MKKFQTNGAGINGELYEENNRPQIPKSYPTQNEIRDESQT
jgi:hypothetical protein